MWKKQNQNQEEELFVRNRLRPFILLTVLLSLVLSSLGNYSAYFSFDKNLLKIQKQILQLKLDSTKLDLLARQSSEPNNCAIDFLLHANAFYKAFIAENQIDYAEYRKIRDDALVHYESLPDTAPYKRFVQSETYLYSAALEGKNQELYSAALYINKANVLITENHNLFPNYLPNNKALGLLKVYLSTVPDKYNWALRLLGIKGNLNEGLRILKKLTIHQNDTTYLAGIAKETAYLYSFALHHIAKKPAKAWSSTLSCTKDYKKNLLSAFFRSSLALKLNKIHTVLNILNDRPRGDLYENFYFLDYLQGEAKLRLFDKRAILNLEHFYKEHKGNNFKQSCLQKMSWYYLLQNDTEKAYLLQQEIKEHSKTLVAKDILAIGYASKPLPNANLLKIKLLYDVGAYLRAKDSIALIDHKLLKNRNEKVEYSYRYGRILEKLGDKDRAARYYEACSLFGLESEEYYASYACIYLGDWYLANSDYLNAEKYYRKALSYKSNKEYVQTIEQRAKNGLKTISKRG